MHLFNRKQIVIKYPVVRVKKKTFLREFWRIFHPTPRSKYTFTIWNRSWKKELNKVRKHICRPVETPWNLYLIGKQLWGLKYSRMAICEQIQNDCWKHDAAALMISFTRAGKSIFLRPAPRFASWQRVWVTSGPKQTGGSFVRISMKSVVVVLVLVYPWSVALWSSGHDVTNIDDKLIEWTDLARSRDTDLREG